jgi:hypothetical protein
MIGRNRCDFKRVVMAAQSQRAEGECWTFQEETELWEGPNISGRNTTANIFQEGTELWEDPNIMSSNTKTNTFQEGTEHCKYPKCRI